MDMNSKINRAKSVKAKKLLIISAIICVIIVFIAIQWRKQHNLEIDRNAELVEYRLDSQPIKNNFPNLPAFEKCFWKSNTIGRTDFGPTNFWLKGFFILNQESQEMISKQYEMKLSNIEFPAGINPEITGYQDFEWYSNKDFTVDVIAPSFLGNIYFDSINGLIYIDVENN